MLPVLLALFESLRRAGVRYCHWKSNWRLAETLRGETDLDLLVHRTDMARFLAVAGALGFKPGSGEDHPSVWHCYGCDDESGRLFDLHVYNRIITGGIIKGYHLPVEEMLLRGARPTEAGVHVPEPAAELVLFVIRKSLDYAAASEALIPRGWKPAADELRWLSEEARDEDVRRLLAEYLPSVDFALFRKLRYAIESGRWGVGRFRLGRALARRLRPYRRFARASATLARSRRAGRKAWRTLRGGMPVQTLLSGGAVIGVVGSDGSGKSTVVGEVSRWLARVEERTYRTIPQPDLVLRLEVPLELAVQRNLTRVKPGGPEPTEYLRQRHARSSELEFAGVPTYRIRTDALVEETVRAVKPILWSAL